MFSLLPFLIYWLALQEGRRFSANPWTDRDALAITHTVALDSQIEECLPQIATLLTSGKVGVDWCQAIEQQEPQRSHLTHLLQTAETLAREGKSSPVCMAPLRARYFGHCRNFVAELVRLSLNLKTIPEMRRLTELHQGLDKLMDTHGAKMEVGSEDLSARSWLNEDLISRRCPEVAYHSIHFPLLDTTNPVLRILRVVSDECELLPSRERCPYLIVAELLQTERHTRCGSAKVYTKGARIGCAIWDVLSNRQFPESLLYPDDHPFARYSVKPFSFNHDYHDEDDYFMDVRAEEFIGDSEVNQDYDHRKWRDLTVTRVFGELWHWKEQRIRNLSPFGRLDGWRLASFIVKAGDDLRGEQLAVQFISMCQQIFREEKLDLWLRPYTILVVGDQAGLIECISDAKSVDHIKKKAPNFVDMREYYGRVFGQPYSATGRRAQYNFMRSLAAYSIVTYLLQVKDRHNANILIDKQGHMIHIDFGFMLGSSPGSVGFESAPFKLTKEYADLLDGVDGPMWHRFREMVVEGFRVLGKETHRKRLHDLVRVSIPDAPAKAGVIDAFLQRLDQAARPNTALSMVQESYDNWRTKMYDRYQERTNGIKP